MGYSFQRYLVAVDDTLYRKANTDFARMLQDPDSHRLPQLAGQRVRTVEVAVALVAREPVAVVRKAFDVLALDRSGCLDASRLRKQQYARIENADSGFCVLRSKVRGERDLVTLIGHAPAVTPGEYASASGNWVTDREHGRQFRAVLVTIAPPKRQPLPAGA